jgi:hypothetical protein
MPSARAACVAIHRARAVLEDGKSLPPPMGIPVVGGGGGAPPPGGGGGGFGPPPPTGLWVKGYFVIS